MRALAILLWALALAGSTLGFALGRAVYDRGVVYGDPGPALPDLDGPERAVNTQLEVEPDEASQRRALQMIRAAGFGWIRQQFSWAAIEGGGKGEFVDSSTGRSTWESYDQIVRLARAEGLQIIARLDLPPAWARPPGSTKSHPPLDVRDYGDFVAAFVERYRGQIGHVQLWNEPNLIVEWGDQPVDPAGYVELLKAGALGARRADPSVRILSGMLAPTLEPDHPGARGLDDLLYLDRMYLHGARPYFDILAGNAYGLHTGPEDRQVGPGYTNFPRLLLTREVMLRHGDGGKAVWVTEFGWNALPPGWTGDPSPWGEVTAEQQASYIVGAYARARREWPWVGPLALWLFRQPSPDPRDPTAYFGLVDPQWRPRPAYDALRATAPAAAPPNGRSLNDSPGVAGAGDAPGAPVLGPGVHQESSAGLHFAGTWQHTPDPAASLNALRESPISGATLRFRFRGTRLELLAPVGPSRGTAYVTVNGAYTLANRLPLNANGQATLDLYAPAPAAQRRLLIADGLPDREHEVELTVTGQAAPPATAPGVGVDAVVVSRARPVLPSLILTGAWAGSVAALLWAVRASPRAVVRAALDRLRALSRSPVGLRPMPSPSGAPGALRLIALDVPSRGATLRHHAGSAFRGALADALRLPWRKLLALAVAAALPLAPVVVRTPVGQFSPIELLLISYVALGLAYLFLDGPHRMPPFRSWGLFAGPALLVILAGALSLLVAEYPRLALREWRVVVLGPAVFYFLARGALKGPRDALALAVAFLAGAGGAALLALGQVALGRDLVAAEGVGRAAALYRSPNNLALLLDRALPLALALSLATASGKGAPPLPLWGSGGWGVRGCTLLCAAALFFTFSRGAWLAAAVACALVLAPYAGYVRRLPRPRRRRLLLLTAAVGVPLLVAAGALALRVERFRSLFAPEGTAVLRLRLWQSALEMALDHPLLGVGLDQFLYLYPRYMHADAWREPNLSHPHNLVLDFWLRLGLPGLIALGWTAWLVFGRCRRALRRAPPGVPLPLVWGVAGALTAVLVHGLLDNSFFVIDLAYGCWVLLLVLELATERPRPDALGAPDASVVPHASGRSSR